MQTHITNHIHHHDLMSDNTLYVIGVCTNPVRYHSRYRIAREWIEHMAQSSNVRLILVEAAFGDRHHELSPENDEYDFLPYRIKSEAWIKESLINLGARHAFVKYNANYLAWIDMDIFFRREDWAMETMQQLQHFSIVQPWQDCADLGPHGGISRHFRSFGFQHQRRKPKQKHPSQPYEYAHSGFAWACTRSFFEQVQGLMNFAILGSADHHMAFACIGETKDTIHKMMHPSFFRKCFEWQDRAMRVTNGEVGFVNGRIEHQFHGPKNRRYYRERWQILVDWQYDPDKDLMTDAQGITTLVGKPKLEHAVKMYNRSRLEDSNEEV
jgi:hypothetical protein